MLKYLHKPVFRLIGVLAFLSAVSWTGYAAETALPAGKREWDVPVSYHAVEGVVKSVYNLYDDYEVEEVEED